ncbi:AlpA family phage regulatory protein [Paraburkholderia sp. GAS334]|uniref:AlpA family phage regulatory protein n=1 Tax=Paraburkholderia sp. GAS334 TaxID=3035131 RepID=UPI003D21B57D
MNALNIKQVAEKVALGQSTIHRLVANGEFPKPFKLVGNRTAWLERDIDSWISEKSGSAPKSEASMTFKLLSPEDLQAITGAQRYSIQAKWFEENFHVKVVCRADGSIVLTQQVFEALLAKRMGVAPKVQTPPEIERPALRPATNRANRKSG